MTNNPLKVITGINTRWSYANVWEPKSIQGSTPKCSVSLTERIVSVAIQAKNNPCTAKETS